MIGVYYSTSVSIHKESDNAEYDPWDMDSDVLIHVLPSINFLIVRNDIHQVVSIYMDHYAKIAS